METARNLDDIFTRMFNETSSDGLSDDVYEKMVKVVSFLSKHYNEIPGTLFRDYMYTTMQILDIKDRKFPEQKHDEIPPSLLDDLRFVSL